MDEELIRARIKQLIAELDERWDHRKVFEIRVLLKELEKRGDSGRQSGCNCC